MGFGTSLSQTSHQKNSARLEGFIFFNFSFIELLAWVSQWRDSWHGENMLIIPCTSRITFYSADAAHRLSAAVETILKEAIKPHEICTVPVSLLLQLTVLPLPLAVPNI